MLSSCGQRGLYSNRVEPRKKVLPTFFWSLVFEAAVGACPIVLPSPDLRLRLGLGKRIKHLHVQKFIPDFGVEAFDKAVLPRFSRLNMDGVRTVFGQPPLQGLFNKFRTVIAPQVHWCASLGKYIRQSADNLCGLYGSVHLDGEALACKLVFQGQYLQPPPIVQGVEHEIVGPDMVGAFGQHGDRVPSFWLFPRSFSGQTEAQQSP